MLAQREIIATLLPSDIIHIIRKPNGGHFQTVLGFPLFEMFQMNLKIDLNIFYCNVDLCGSLTL